MVHQYQLNGYNIVLDSCSGSVHVVDDVAYDVIAMYKEHSADEIVAAMLAKYADRPECKDCWAKLYCSGGCAANAYHATGSITGVYEYGCELFKKRVECAIMIKVAENQELAAQGIEVPIELGGTCNACADGEACE